MRLATLILFLSALCGLSAERRPFTFHDQAFMGSIGGTNIPPAPPTFITSGLIHYIESDVFDGSSGGTSVTAWNDLTANGNNWASVGTAPTVNSTNTANGHKTVRFEPSKFMRVAKFFQTGYAGLEIMAVFKLDADPPNVAGSSRVFEFNKGTDIPEQPYVDGNWYECFGRTTRPSIGDPTTNAAAAFFCYNISSKADGTAYDVWLNAENLLHLTSSYTYQYTGSEGSYYYLGDGVSSLSIKGSIAAIYIWNRRLDTGERTTMRTYINGKWGTSIP